VACVISTVSTESDPGIDRGANQAAMRGAAGQPLIASIAVCMNASPSVAKSVD
jgi:hypothetical protein